MPAVFHVSLNGNDAFPGTATNPFRTIQRAIDQASQLLDGQDVINVAAGVYDQAGFDLSIVVADNPNLTDLRLLGGFNPAGFTERTPGTTIYLPQTAGNQATPDVAVADPMAAIDGFTWVFDGMLGPGGARPGGGIIVTGPGFQLMQNTIEPGSSSGPAAFDNFGFRTGQGSTQTGLVIQNNQFRAGAANPSGAIFLLPGTSGGVVIQNNLIAGPRLGRGIAVDGVSNVQILGNMISRTGPADALFQELIIVGPQLSMANQSNLVLGGNLLDGGGVANSIGIRVAGLDAGTATVSNVVLNQNQVANHDREIVIGPRAGQVTVNGALGDDEVTVRAPLSGPVQVSGGGGAGLDRLIIEGTPLAEAFTVTDKDVQGTGNLVTFDGLTDLRVLAQAGDDSITVLSTLPAVELDGNGGNDRLEVQFGALVGRVTVGDSGSAADTDRLVLDGAATGETLTITDTAVTQDADGDGMDDAALDYGGMEEVVVQGQRGDDLLIVNGSAAASTVDGGSGADQIQVNLGSLFGPVTLDDSGGLAEGNQVIVKATAGEETVTLDATRIDRDADGDGVPDEALRYNTPSTVFADLEINLQDGNDPLAILGNSTLTRILGGAGDDQITINGPGLAGELFVNGEDGNDLVSMVAPLAAPVAVDGGQHLDGDHLEFDLMGAGLVANAEGLTATGSDPLAVFGFEDGSLTNLDGLALDGDDMDNVLVVFRRGPNTNRLQLDGGLLLDFPVDTWLRYDGKGGSDVLEVREAGGLLPLFAGMAVGGHTNAAFLDSGLAPGNVGLHFQGGGGVQDLVRYAFDAGHDVAYFADDAAAANSGVLNVDGALTMSFAELTPIQLTGAGGKLTIDASSTAATTMLTVTDAADLNSPGETLVDGDGGFEAVRFSGFQAVEIRGGAGDETIDLISLDSAANANNVGLSQMILDGDNTNSTDAGNDVLRVRSLPAAVTASLLGGLGDDTFVIGAVSLSSELVLGQMTVSPPGDEGGNDELRVENGNAKTAINAMIAATALNGVTGAAVLPQVIYNTGDLIEDITLFGTEGFGDVFDIQSTQAGSRYRVITDAAAANDDLVNLSSDAPANLGVLNDLDGSIRIETGGGSDTVTLSDRGDAAADSYNLSLAAGFLELSFADGAAAVDVRLASGQIELFNLLGSDGGSDTFTIGASLAGGSTFISGGAGDDSFMVNALDSVTVLEGNVGNDSFTVNGSGAPATLRGGDGDDRMTVLAAVGGPLTLEGNDDQDEFFASFGSLARLVAIDGGGNADGVTLLGTGGSDTIAIAATRVYRDTNGDAAADEQVNFAAVEALFVDAQAGNDVLVLTGLIIPTSVAGGLGDDEFAFRDGAGLAGGTVDGGPGVNLLNHSAATTPVNVDLAAAAATGTGGLFRIQNVVGGAAADTIRGDAASNRLEGRGGNDTISGRDGDDTSLGGVGDDVIEGDAGNDRLEGGDGNDTVAGGLGDDTQIGGAGEDVLAGDEGNDRLEGSIGNDQILGGDGDDTALGGDGGDSLLGNAGNDRLEGNEGLDTMLGGDSDDLLLGGAEADLLEGGAGADRLEGAAGNDSLAGQDGDDTLLGGDSDDLLQGNDGNDRIEGQGGNDLAEGGLGNDLILGGLGDDLLRGNEGNDTIQGNDGNDRLEGGNGDDRLRGMAGRDTVLGELGFDDIVIENPRAACPGGTTDRQNFGGRGRDGGRYMLRRAADNIPETLATPELVPLAELTELAVTDPGPFLP